MVSLLLAITVLVIALPLILVYAYAGYTVQVIGRKLGHTGTWKAWVPIANLFFFCEIAQKPAWWVLLMFIPVVNVAILAMVWIEIARLLGKPAWVGFLVAMPIVQYPAVGYLAGLKRNTLVGAMSVLVLSFLAIPIWANYMSSPSARVTLLIADLKDNDENQNVRSNAIYELEKIGTQSDKVIPTLTELIKDQDVVIRQGAVEALRRIGPAAKSAVPSLIQMIENDGIHEIHRVAAAESLLKIDPQDQKVVEAVVQLCIKAIKSRHQEASRQSVGILNNLGAQAYAAVPALIEILKDEKLSSQIGNSAADALGNIGPDAKDAIPELVKRRDIKGLFKVGEAAIPALKEMAGREPWAFNKDALCRLGQAVPPSVTTAKIMSELSIAVELVNSQKIYPWINADDCIKWPEPEIKRVGGANAWVTLKPQNGDRGTVISMARHCIQGECLYILKMKNYYLVASYDGIKLGQ